MTPNPMDANRASLMSPASEGGASTSLPFTPSNLVINNGSPRSSYHSARSQHVAGSPVDSPAATGAMSQRSARHGAFGRSGGGPLVPEASVSAEEWHNTHTLLQTLAEQQREMQRQLLALTTAQLHRLPPAGGAQPPPSEPSSSATFVPPAAADLLGEASVMTSSGAAAAADGPVFISVSEWTALQRQMTDLRSENEALHQQTGGMRDQVDGLQVINLSNPLAHPLNLLNSERIYDSMAWMVTDWYQILYVNPC